MSDDDWMTSRFWFLFNWILVILRWWEGGNKGFCAIKRRLGTGRIIIAGLESASPYLTTVWENFSHEQINMWEKEHGLCACRER